MADLVQALAGMFDGGDMTIFQATVDAVGTGVVTIHFNGGTFTDVPYMANGFPVGAGIGAPSIGDTCYVIGRKNWGLLVLGKPAPGPSRSVSSGAERLWTPHSLYKYTESPGTWSTTGLWSEQTIADPAPGTTVVFFYNAADMPATGSGGFATSSFFLDIDGPIDTGGWADHAYYTVGLVSNTDPTGALVKMENLDASYTVSTSAGLSQYISIPIDWAVRLFNGTAHGIYVKTEEWPLTVNGPGTLRITEL